MFLGALRVVTSVEPSPEVLLGARIRSLMRAASAGGEMRSD